MTTPEQSLSVEEMLKTVRHLKREAEASVAVHRQLVADCEQQGKQGAADRYAATIAWAETKAAHLNQLLMLIETLNSPKFLAIEREQKRRHTPASVRLEGRVRSLVDPFVVDAPTWDAALLEAHKVLFPEREA